MKSYIVNVEAAIYKRTEAGLKWLVIKRSDREEHAPGIISLVGGKVETEEADNDVLEKTVRREVEEEVGVRMEGRLEYLESTSFWIKEGYLVIDIIFLAEFRSGPARVCDTDEVAEVYWLNREEIAAHEKAPDYLLNTVDRARRCLQEKTL